MPYPCNDPLCPYCRDQRREERTTPGPYDVRNYALSLLMWVIILVGGYLLWMIW